MNSLRNIRKITLALIVMYIFGMGSLYAKSYPHAGYLKHKTFEETLEKILAPKFHYNVYGYGGSSTRDFVRLISASIQCSENYSIEELEDIFIESVETLLWAYNSNKRIRPLLIDYPVTLENLEISMSAVGVGSKSAKTRIRIAYAPVPPYQLIYYYHDLVTNKRSRTEIGEFGTYEELKARREAARGRPFLED